MNMSPLSPESKIPKIIRHPAQDAVTGSSFEIHEWTGSGPDYMHVHYSDDEAWHVLEGRLVFRFEDGEREASGGSTVFVPAGVPHTYCDPEGRSRYLMILTPNLSRLIRELHQAPIADHGEIMRKYRSEIVS